MNTWLEKVEHQALPLLKVADLIEDHDKIWVSPITDAPYPLLDVIDKQKKQYASVELRSGLLLKPYSFMGPDSAPHIKYGTYFLGPGERPYYKQGGLEMMSISLSQVKRALRDEYHPSVMLATVSRPNAEGYFSYGGSGGMVNHHVAQSESCQKIIVLVNEEMPFVHGPENMIHFDEIDYFFRLNYPLPTLDNAPVDEEYEKIASFISPYIYDGDTLQIGIGNLGNAVALQLEDKKDLGIHTEMMVDALHHLIEKGVVTGKKKSLHPGKIVFSFSAGSQAMYQFFDDNPDVLAKPFDYVNNALVIAQNDNMVSINSCMQVDLLGQVSSESIGFEQYSATGGQADFIRGASLAKNGRSFLGLKSTAVVDGEMISTIKLSHEEGTAITTPRFDVQYLVTEYGIANLKNISIAERARRIIALAHPDFREELLREALEKGIIRELQKTPAESH